MSVYLLFNVEGLYRKGARTLANLLLIPSDILVLSQIIRKVNTTNVPYLYNCKMYMVITIVNWDIVGLRNESLAPPTNSLRTARKLLHVTVQ